MSEPYPVRVMISLEPCWRIWLLADFERATIRSGQSAPDFTYGEEDGQQVLK